METTITQDRSYLRQLETRDLLLLAQNGTNELAFVLGERLKQAADDAQDRESDLHGDCCTCFD